MGWSSLFLVLWAAFTRQPEPRNVVGGPGPSAGRGHFLNCEAQGASTKLWRPLSWRVRQRRTRLREEAKLLVPSRMAVSESSAPAAPRSLASEVGCAPEPHDSGAPVCRRPKWGIARLGAQRMTS